MCILIFPFSTDLVTFGLLQVTSVILFCRIYPCKFFLSLIGANKNVIRVGHQNTHFLVEDIFSLFFTRCNGGFGHRHAHYCFRWRLSSARLCLQVVIKQVGNLAQPMCNSFAPLFTGWLIISINFMSFKMLSSRELKQPKAPRTCCWVKQSCVHHQ